VKRIAIIGGGISGLAAAFALEKQRRGGAPLEYALFESSPRFGGVVATERVDGCIVEAGPDSFLTEKSWASDLCREVGLSDQLIGSNDATRKTYILVEGNLVAIPDGLMFMVPTKIKPMLFSPLFSTATKLRMACEWFQSPRKSDADESAASFVDRHYGKEMVDRLADPLLSGVYGGEASQLSVRAVLPRFVEMETVHGSLGRGMLAAGKKIVASLAEPKPLFTSLKDGMQQMVEAVVSLLPGSALHSGTPVQRLQPQNGGWIVSTNSSSEHFDAVVVATPANTAAELMQAASTNLAAELRGIPYTSSITVNLGYDRRVRTSLPPGFGFLVPRSEGKRLLAATFVHNKFPYRAPEDRALLRCFIGGARNEQVLQASDEEILRIVREDLRTIIGIEADPIFVRIYRWKGAMAQYNVGHLERLQRIDNLLQQLHGVALAGNGYRGIGVPDCIRSGSEAAGKVLRLVGLKDGSSPALAS
jgi:protoporphyrinogen/coproporphyrinogen III oxidase